MKLRPQLIPYAASTLAILSIAACSTAQPQATADAAAAPPRAGRTPQPR